MTKIYQPTFALNEQGDSYLDDNKNIAMIYGVDSVAQTVSTNLRMWLGEYDFNTTIGMPYNVILGEELNKLLLYTNIKNVVESVKYVTKVNTIDFIQDRENRKTTVTVNFDTIETKGVVANAII